MEVTLRDWYELKFSLQFRSLVGTEFQDFFASIMELGYPADFERVKPYGKNGDRKCDGYHRSHRRVYQVYAPEKMQVVETNAKIDEDFTGALGHWSKEMATWVFVHNQWRGIPADVLKKLLGIHGMKGVSVLSWSEPELRGEFFLLSSHDQARLLGPAMSLLVGAVGIEPSALLQTRNLFIPRFDESDRNARNDKLRYKKGTKEVPLDSSSQ
jgi:hypothetical protein